MQDGLREDARRVAIDHHDDVADVFEAFYESEGDRYQAAFHYGRYKLDCLLDAELKKLEPGARVLDAGCGTGEYVKRLRALGFDASGVEPAPSMRERAQKQNPGATILDGLITELPFDDGTFQLAMAIEVVRYLHKDDVVRGTKELMRVLAPGGVAFVTYVTRYALDGFYPWQRVRQLVRGKSFDRTHPHCEFTTPAEVRADFEAAGATDIRVLGRLFAPIRIVYRANERLGARLAKLVEPYDDLVSELPWTVPFAGHLVAIAGKP